MGELYVADLFCGAGGTSTGLVRACRRLGSGLWLQAINHWDLAIATHQANHPDTYPGPLCAGLDNVSPRHVVPGGYLDLLWASPECMYHSLASAGKPIKDQSRATAHHVTQWADALNIRHIIVENVPQFLDWGPLDEHGQKILSRKGETFRAFIALIKSLGYDVSWRVLCCADYGDPTSRHRLFIQARKDGKPITWPKPTHGPGTPNPYLPASQIVRWDLAARALDGSQPLAPATMKRIETGIERFGREPFYINYNGTGTAQSLGRPLRTVTGADRFALVYRENGRTWFRMFHPDELAAAQGFPPGYWFAGRRKDQVKQIGNANPVNTAAALCYNALAGAERWCQ